MAYQEKKPKDRADTLGADQRPNPYDAMTGPTLQTAPVGFSPDFSGVTGAQPPAGALPGSSGGPSATGHVNFDQVYNANAGVAQRESEKARSAAEGKAKAAQQGLTGAQNQFQGAVKAGSVASPTAQDAARAGGAQDFWAAGKGAPTAPMTNQLASRQSTSGGDLARDTEENWLGNMKNAAGKGYTGPASMSAMDLYGKLAQDTTAAQDAVNNPLADVTNDLDRALLGAAGRPRLESLKSQYSGLKGNLEAANLRSVDEAKAAKANSAGASNAYDELLDQYDASKKPPPDTAIHLGAANSTLGPESGSTGDQLTENGKYSPGLGSQEDYDSVFTKMGLDPKSKKDRDLLSKFITSQDDWRMLYDMTPEQAAAWLAQRREETGY